MKIRNLDEKITGIGKKLGDFLQWAYSDILSNRNRGILAEYIVASALECTDIPRIEWDEADINYNGKKIEVKCSAYIQSWKQNSLSKITFDIAKKKSWNAATNVYSNEAKRNSDCYVFCILSEKDPEKINPLDIYQWVFMVLDTVFLNEKFKDQKRISLSTLEKNTGKTDYFELKSEIERKLNRGDKDGA